jgi:hypothetical protein
LSRLHLAALATSSTRPYIGGAFLHLARFTS